MATFETLQALQHEVGSRRFGTEGERRARAWLQAQCQALNLVVELDPFSLGVWRHVYLRPLILLVWSLVFWGVQRFDEALGNVGLFLGVVPTLLTYLPPIDRWIEAKLARTMSYNVVAGLGRPFSAYIADPAKKPVFLVSAHYDTAQNYPDWFHKIRPQVPYWTIVSLLPLGWIALSILGPLALILMTSPVILLALLTHWAGLTGLAGPFVWLSSLGFSAGQTLLTITYRLDPWMARLALVIYGPFMLVALFYMLNRLLRPSADSPGANDNGSGAALVLELARRLQAKPLANAEVFFVWWGAEEEGLCGSRHFVRRFGPQLDQDKFYLINADCVGVGEFLVVSTGLGLFRRRPIDPTLVWRVEQIAARLGVKTMRAWNSVISGYTSDHAEWLKKGFSHVAWFLRDNRRRQPLLFGLATRLLRIPDTRLPSLRNTHSPDDTLEHIHPQTLEETTNMAEAYIRETDAALQPA